MAPRKKANVVPPVEPATEQPPEQPVIRNDVPAPTLNAIPVRVERNNNMQPSTVRRPSKSNKGGAKSGNGKGVPSRNSSSSRNQGTSTTKRKKKKSEKSFMVKGKGNSQGELKYRPSKKTKKKATAKRFTKR